ncbi:hypothetical protein [Sandaracinus amylolyticus]|uniref:Uncharacterized protein n=1 Tax=Sandaracinus amylolyticus TaxID=927083 RepID=A0A0F6W0R0_9BACT|nr:hypothetical protein [Sandaracinus amylolyticus]AKF04290.1 hypothetical protein DB32_001439 [Sandaracinus amylolyticus]
MASKKMRARPTVGRSMAARAMPLPAMRGRVMRVRVMPVHAMVLGHRTEPRDRRSAGAYLDADSGRVARSHRRDRARRGLDVRAARRRQRVVLDRIDGMAALAAGGPRRTIGQ